MSAISPAVKRWYEHGLVLSSMDSRKEWMNSSDNYVIKRLVAYSVQNEIKESDLILVVEIEVVSLEEGEDKGFFEPGKEVYRMPFPWDRESRKGILRSCVTHPKFFLA